MRIAAETAVFHLDDQSGNRLDVPALEVICTYFLLFLMLSSSVVQGIPWQDEVCEF